MGTIHKFRPPPKNERQFKGYRPLATGGFSPKKRRPWLVLWYKLRSWQQSLVAWMLLIGAATVIVSVMALLRR